MSLESGRRILSNKWVEMPTTQVQINRVHELASDRGQVHLLDELGNHQENHNVNDKFSTVSYAVQEDSSSSLDEQASMADTSSCDSNHDLDVD